MKKPLPEEKLLKLIKEGKTSRRAAAAVEPENGGVVISAASGPLRLRLAFTHLRAGAVVLFGLSLALLLKNLLFPYSYREPPKPVVSRGRVDRAPAEKPLEFYLSGKPARTVFRAAASGSGSGFSGPSEEALFTEQIKNLSLLGIISGDSPQAIIEDKKSQQTYYLKTGMSVGDIVIADIQENKVILDYKGKNAEIHL